MGDMWPMFNTQFALFEYHHRPRARRAAESPADGGSFDLVTGEARVNIVGLLILVFYLRGWLVAIDMLLAVTGAYAGLAEGYGVWRGRRPSPMGVFRVVSPWLYAAWGFAGWTAAGV